MLRSRDTCWPLAIMLSFAVHLHHAQPAAHNTHGTSSAASYVRYHRLLVARQPAQPLSRSTSGAAHSSLSLYMVLHSTGRPPVMLLPSMVLQAEGLVLHQCAAEHGSLKSQHYPERNT